MRERERQTDREIDRETDRETDRQPDRQTELAAGRCPLSTRDTDRTSTCLVTGFLFVDLDVATLHGSFLGGVISITFVMNRAQQRGNLHRKY